MEPAEENAAAAVAVDAVTQQMTNRFSAINTDDAGVATLKLDDADGNVYICKHCRTHLAVAGDIISKAFHCEHGKAYLFHKVVNVTSGVQEDRMMFTGMHTVSDILCVGCGSIAGWKYEAAREKSQKYKEGKFILKRYKVSGPDGSDADDV